MFRAARTRRTLPTWAFSCLILVSTTLAAWGVSGLRERADSARDEQVLLEQIRGLVGEQSGLEWQAVAARGLRREVERDFGVRRARVDETLGRLSAAGRPAPAELQAAIDTHQDALGAELRLLAQGRDAAAIRAGERRVDPALRNLLDTLEASRANSSREASSAAFQANVGTALVLGLVALFLVLLFRAFHGTRRSLAGAEERVLAESERWFRSLVQNASEVIAVVDPDTTVRYMTDSVEALLGYEPDHMLGRKLVGLAHPDDVAELQAAVSLPGGSAFECRIWSEDATWVFMEWTRGPRQDAAGCILTGRDVSERKQLESELRRQAFHDELTGLANRALLENRLRHALAGLRRLDRYLAVLFLDLDDFKTVNDGLGHSVGDALLQAVAGRLSDTLRDSDTAARLGGDEFCLLLDVANASGANDAAARLLVALEPPFEVEGRELSVHASIGIALASTGDELLEDLMRNADLAMYEAKRRGGRQARVYEQELHDVALGRLELGAELQKAIDECQFELHYQPIVRLDNAAIVGAEALIRWRHPRRGLVAPGQFLPLAEKTGLIVPIGRWVLQEACRTLAAWHGDLQRADLPYLTVNVAMPQLHEPGIVEEVRAALDSASVSPEHFVLEITESSLADDTESVLARLQNLRALGVRLAVDDFGTGYSALSYLQRFPIDMLKIDRSFVEHARDSSPSLNLVRSIVQLGRSLHLEIVPEGIEEEEQADNLIAMGVSIGQGFYYAAPLTADHVATLLAYDARLSPEGRAQLAIESAR